MLNAHADGLLIALSDKTSEYTHIQRLVDEEIPVVFMDRMCEDIHAPYVTTDDFEGEKTATQYLIDQGCNTIGFIQGPENISTTFNRLTGYKEALKANNIHLNEALIIKHENIQGFKSRVLELAQKYKIDGLLTHSDYHAFRAMKVLQQHSFEIPTDVQIIGYADEPLATYTTPTITTVKQPAFMIGKVGMELLLHQINTGKSREPVILDTELIIRESTR